MTAGSERLLSKWIRRRELEEAILATVMISLPPRSGVRQAIKRRLEATE